MKLPPKPFVRLAVGEFCKLVNALRSFQKYLPQAQVGFLLSSNLEANLAAIQHEVLSLHPLLSLREV